MPLLIQNSMTLGPRPAAAPSTLVAYLTSIGKASWYGIYEAGYEMYANSDGSGGAVADGGAVGCWGPREQVSFSHKFIQATAASRPVYSTTLYSTGPTVAGNGTSWLIALNSTTALNLECSILTASEYSSTSNNVLWSQGSNWSLRASTSTGPILYYSGSNATNKYNSFVVCTEAINSATPTSRKVLVGASSHVGNTGRYNTALTLFNIGVQYVADGIRRIAITPRLTQSELIRALSFLE